jgi:hypothetical protein
MEEMMTNTRNRTIPTLLPHEIMAEYLDDLPPWDGRDRIAPLAACFDTTPSDERDVHGTLLSTEDKLRDFLEDAVIEAYAPRERGLGTLLHFRPVMPYPNRLLRAATHFVDWLFPSCYGHSVVTGLCTDPIKEVASPPDWKCSYVWLADEADIPWKEVILAAGRVVFVCIASGLVDEGALHPYLRLRTIPLQRVRDNYRSEIDCDQVWAQMVHETRKYIDDLWKIERNLPKEENS